MTRTQAIMVAAGGSLALLAGAFLFQAFGYAPCKLCLWQRWPHAAAILLGVVALLLPGRLWPALGALAALATAGVGLYHTGVERGWWEGPDTCTAGPVANLSPEDLLAQIESAPLVRCDEVAWQLAGLSMASWNAVLSLALVAVWLVAVSRSAPRA